MSRKRHTIRSRVYIAGPISQGNSVMNCQRAIEVGFQLMDLGYAPIVPHYSYFVDPQSTEGRGRYAQWLELDYSYITTCQALLRLPGPSKGADREVAWARTIGVPVFLTLEKIIANISPSYSLDTLE